MPTFLDPSTGVLRRCRTSPGEAWREVWGSGTLFRTRRGDTWVAERGHASRARDYERDGWERIVSWDPLPLPPSWHLGTRSGLRFGFAEPGLREPGASVEAPVTAVVLPGEPALASSAGCPGSRYVMQVGMLVGGVPADYLVQKVLTARLRALGFSLEDFVFNLHVGSKQATGSQERRLAELHMLAEGLSDDLQEAARATFGTGMPTTAWNRKRQLAFMIHRFGPSAN